jgi:hypothetical protein
LATARHFAQDLDMNCALGADERDGFKECVRVTCPLIDDVEKSTNRVRLEHTRLGERSNKQRHGEGGTVSSSKEETNLHCASLRIHM